MKSSTPKQAKKPTSLLAATFFLLILTLLSRITTVSCAPTPTTTVLPAKTTVVSSTFTVSVPTVNPHVNSTSSFTATTTIANATSTSTIHTTITPTPVFILPPPAPIPTRNSTIDYLITCPPPLIPNLMNITSSSCMGNCCIPCPASAMFYKPNQLESIYTITSISRALSAIACAVLAVSYIMSPRQRKHPHTIVLVFGLLMIPWEGLGTIWLYKREDLLCKNAYEVTNMDNSRLCGLQGIAFVYLIFAMLCLGFILIANLHFLAVYNSYLVQSHMTKLIVLSFILPLSLVIPIVVKRQIMNPGFGSICFVGPDISDAYFFIPMSVMVSLAMLMHLATIGSMIKTKLKANCAANSSCNSGRNSPSSMQSRRQRHLKTARDISLLLKQQWRPGLFAVCLIIMDMVYWIFYFMEAKGLMDLSTTSQGLMDWVHCLSNNMKFAVQSGQLSLVNPTVDQVKAVGQASQTACAYAAEPWVPNITWAALAAMIPALFGVVLLIIFGSRVELWRDLRTWLFGEYNTTTRGDTSKDSLIEYPERSVEKRLPAPPRPKYPTYQDSFLESRSPSTTGSRNGYVVSPKRFSQLISKTPNPNPDSTYRSDTPEAWKFTPTSTQGNGAGNLSRVNSNSDNHSGRPAVQSNSESQNKASLASSSQHQKRFYNTEDFEALPIFLVTPPPTYYPNNNNSQRGLPLLATDDDLYPDNDVQMAVVSEACRVQLNYRTNVDTRYFQQPQVVHQMRSQRGESLPPPVRPRNPARNRPLRASSPALSRTQNLTRNDAPNI